MTDWQAASAPQLAEEIVRLLGERGQTVATAESCTGGMIAAELTGVSGASAVFECGIVAYANRIKEEKLGVAHQTLERWGAVSEPTAREMADGVMRAAASSFGVSVTGIAGPTGGTPEKPVGTVHIAACSQGNCLHEKLELYKEGFRDRPEIRAESARRALRLLLRLLQEAE